MYAVWSSLLYFDWYAVAHVWWLIHIVFWTIRSTYVTTAGGYIKKQKRILLTSLYILFSAGVPNILFRRFASVCYHSLGICFSQYQCDTGHCVISFWFPFRWQLDTQNIYEIVVITRILLYLIFWPFLLQDQHFEEKTKDIITIFFTLENVLQSNLTIIKCAGYT